MGNATMFDRDKANKPGLVALYGTVTLDGAGDISAYSMRGVSGVAHTATGRYTFTLAEKWYSLEAAEVRVLKAGAPGVNGFIYSKDTTGSTPTIQLGFENYSAALANPVSCVLYVYFELKNTSA